MRTLLLATLLVLVPVAAEATHPCFGPDCGIPHDVPPKIPHCRGYPGDVVATVVLCVKEALP